MEIKRIAIGSIAIIGAIALICLLMPSTYAEMVNPNFENGLDGWLINPGNTSGQYNSSYVSVTTNSYSGNYAIRSIERVISSPLSFTMGTLYQDNVNLAGVNNISFMMAYEPSNPKNCYAQIIIYDNGGFSNARAMTRAYTSLTNYNRYTYDISSLGLSGSYRVALLVAASGSGGNPPEGYYTFYIDDVRFNNVSTFNPTPTPTPTPVPAYVLSTGSTSIQQGATVTFTTTVSNYDTANIKSIIYLFGDGAGPEWDVPYVTYMQPSAGTWQKSYDGSTLLSATSYEAYHPLIAFPAAGSVPVYAGLYDWSSNLIADTNTITMAVAGPSSTAIPSVRPSATSFPTVTAIPGPTVIPMPTLAPVPTVAAVPTMAPYTPPGSPPSGSINPIDWFNWGFGVLKSFYEFAIAAVTWLVAFLGAYWNYLTGTFPDYLGALAQNVLGWLSNALNAVIGWLTAQIQLLIDQFTIIKNSIIDMVNDLVGSLGDILEQIRELPNVIIEIVFYPVWKFSQIAIGLIGYVIEIFTRFFNNIRLMISIVVNTMVGVFSVFLYNVWVTIIGVGMAIVVALRLYWFIKDLEVFGTKV